MRQYSAALLHSTRVLVLSSLAYSSLAPIARPDITDAIDPLLWAVSSDIQPRPPNTSQPITQRLHRCMSGVRLPDQALPWSGARVRASADERGQRQRRRRNAVGDLLVNIVSAEALPHEARGGKEVRVWVLGAAS